MRVTQALPFDLYWDAYKEKRPSDDPRGDNIYMPDPNVKFVQVPNGSHDEGSTKRDLSVNRVLISTHFYYFGRTAPCLPAQCENLLATTQGHRRIRPDASNHRQFVELVEWLESAYQTGRQGDPHLEEVICLPPEEEDQEVEG
jgi:putative DNA base modification enzyme with NMAD domain